MVDFIAVTKEEFDAFLAAYPRPLERDVTMICEPPCVSFNDFQRAPYWPDSVVASYMYDTPSSFRVLSDIEAPVEDDGERDTDKPLFDRKGREVREGDRIRVGWGFTFNTQGIHDQDVHEHVAAIRDKDTKYERWSFDDCHNFLRGFDFKVVESREDS